jgi:hypothetical protein
MSAIADLQAALDQIGEGLGVVTQAGFEKCYLSDWPDEESVTGALLGSLTTAAKLLTQMMASQPGPSVELRAILTQKRNEARHGVDALIRFRCVEEEWPLHTAVLLQAKRQEPGEPLSSAEFGRLRLQVRKMLAHTTECFIMVYSKENGICLFPAVAVDGLRGRDLFDLAFIPWPRFLSGVLRGRFGEPSPERLPQEGVDGMPMFELELEMALGREESNQNSMTV